MKHRKHKGRRSLNIYEMSTFLRSGRTIERCDLKKEARLQTEMLPAHLMSRSRRHSGRRRVRTGRFGTVASHKASWEKERADKREYYTDRVGTTRYGVCDGSDRTALQTGFRDDSPIVN